MRRVLTSGCALALAALAFTTTGAAADLAPVPIVAGSFESVLPQGKGVATVQVRAFRLDRTPVTNAQFLRFVRSHPQWRRDRIARLFADAQYLTQWQGAITLGAAARAAQPVTRVSWFAAKAYCEARGARLPTWNEWEYVAAADESVADARGNPVWRQRILDWYARPSGVALSDVGHGPPNYYGVSDMHGLTWEWVLDYNALLVSSDSREQGGADKTKFCGEGALSTTDRDNYAVLMRIAFLSSLEAGYTTANLGFRCATDAP
ncbi:MAG: formylglycine-generating enzyme family protein [Pseudomonadota bacterium]